MAERADVEQALATLEAYQREMEALGRQIGFMQSLGAETARARQSLEGLRTEPAPEVLLPVGGNIFIPATLTKRDKAIVGVGAGISMEKPWAEAEERLAKREKEIEAELQKMGRVLGDVQEEASQLEARIQQGLDVSREGKS